jgi:hypothetical protein
VYLCNQLVHFRSYIFHICSINLSTPLSDYHYLHMATRLNVCSIQYLQSSMKSVVKRREHYIECSVLPPLTWRFPSVLATTISLPNLQESDPLPTTPNWINTGRQTLHLVWPVGLSQTYICTKMITYTPLSRPVIPHSLHWAVKCEVMWRPCWPAQEETTRRSDMGMKGSEWSHKTWKHSFKTSSTFYFQICRKISNEKK